jgi:hypothetical protein
MLMATIVEVEIAIDDVVRIGRSRTSFATAWTDSIAATTQDRTPHYLQDTILILEPDNLMEIPI